MNVIQTRSEETRHETHSLRDTTETQLDAILIYYFDLVMQKLDHMHFHFTEASSYGGTETFSKHLGGYTIRYSTGGDKNLSPKFLAKLNFKLYCKDSVSSAI